MFDCSNSLTPPLYSHVKTSCSVKEVREGSDAVACSNLIPFCRPRCVGVQFLLVGLAFQVIGIYLAMVWLISA